MSDIFLSYKGEDRSRAKIIAETFEQYGYSVWWDRIIPPGKSFDEVIEEELDASKCVVVLWSKESVKSKWVKTEASEGDRREILVPILIDNVKIPLEFRRIQAAALIDWQGTLPNPEFDLLLNSVSVLVGRPPTQKNKIMRPSTPIATSIGSKTLSASEWFNKGFNFGELGKYQEAIEAYDKALEIDPQYKDAWNNKGLALVSLGRYQEAIEAYDKALEIDPQFKLARSNKGNALGVALDNLGRYQEAIEAYDKALKIDPQYKFAWNNKGLALYNLGRHQEAIEAYDKALKIDPQYKDAWNNKGVALDNLGRYQEAIEAYDKTLKIDPQFKLALENKEIALEKLRR